MKSNHLHKYLKGVIFLLIGFVLHSCSIVEPPSPTPTYVSIESIQLTTDYATQGSNASKISDAWILIDGVYLGTFPLPCKFPISGTGTHKITVKAGIVIDGISGMRSAFPKYANFDTTINDMVAAKTYAIHPIVRYESYVTFPIMEDFDDASLNLVKTTQGNTAFTIITPPDPNVFEGNSGKVTLLDTNTVFEVAGNLPYYLPVTALSYVELNYKSDIDFVVGTYITTSSVTKWELLSIRASNSWKKIYINLNDLGGIISSGVAYNIYLRAEKPANVTTANLYFDNFKVVY